MAYVACTEVSKKKTKHVKCHYYPLNYVIRES